MIAKCYTIMKLLFDFKSFYYYILDKGFKDKVMFSFSYLPVKVNTGKNNVSRLLNYEETHTY